MGGGMQHDDEDYHLIPKLVSNTVLPVACDAVEFDWNCRSSLSTKKVLRLWNELSDFLDDKEDSQMKELREVILERVHETIGEAYLPRIDCNTPELEQFAEMLFW